MILDAQAIFSDKQAITKTAPSTNMIDLGVHGKPVGGRALTGDLGKGNKVPVLVQVTETFAGLTSLKMELESSATSAFTTHKTLYSQTLSLNELVAGARWSLQVLPCGTVNRYLRLKYTVEGTGTAGRMTAGVTRGNDETQPY